MPKVISLVTLEIYVTDLTNIRNAIKDDSVKALVLRVNSPGGDVWASELITNALNEFKSSGRPIVSSSANLSGEKIPLNFSEINSRIINNVDYVVKQDKDKNSHSSSRILKLEEDGSILTLR